MWLLEARVQHKHACLDLHLLGCRNHTANSNTFSLYATRLASPPLASLLSTETLTTHHRQRKETHRRQGIMEAEKR